MNLRGVLPNSRRGFTLIELLLVMSLMLMVGVFMFPVELSFYRSEILNGADEGLTNALRRAQSFSIAGKHGSAFGVRIEEDAYILFEGESYASRLISEDESFSIPSNLLISGFEEVVFSQHEGLPGTDGALILTLENKTSSILVFPSGLIE